jgi:hypothetical protein
MNGNTPNLPLPSSFQKLWQLAIREAINQDIKPENVFGDIGLYLVYPPLHNNPHRYDCTPINSSTFGDTGGDGVHFGLLHTSELLHENSPVIMTVPMNFSAERNWILGADLLEFLALGCQVGFFFLEQIAYTRTRMNESQKRYPINFSDFEPISLEDRVLLDVIAREFPLKPWPVLTERLDELEMAFHSLIQLDMED